FDASELGDHLGSRTVDRRSVAELPHVVLAPAGDRLVRKEGAEVRREGDLNDWFRKKDRHRLIPIGRTSVEPAIRIGAPAPKGAVLQNRAGVGVQARKNRRGDSTAAGSASIVAAHIA